MKRLRRRLASCALALTVLQTAMAFAAPLSGCCPSRTAAAAAADKDCCPAGSHPPGECPLHARSKASTKLSCRMQCDAPHGAGYIIAAFGVLPSPLVVSTPVTAAHPFAIALDVPVLRTSTPDSPPPRVL